MARPGDRRQRWNQSHTVGGLIMFFIGGVLICNFTWFSTLLGIIHIGFAMLDFRDVKRGWPMSKKRPPWADRHGAIDRKWAVRVKEIKES